MSRGIETKGVGRRITSHLNLTRSLAEVWHLSYAEIAKVRKELHGGPARPPREAGAAK